jgi:hypothetical protein
MSFNGAFIEIGNSIKRISSQDQSKIFYADAAQNLYSKRLKNRKAAHNTFIEDENQISEDHGCRIHKAAFAFEAIAGKYGTSIIQMIELRENIASLKVNQRSQSMPSF